jgi:glycosyltransferase involved in cell wall biosynthesis
VARVLTAYPGPRPGGLARRLTRAIEALLARGHAVHLLAVEPFPLDHPRLRQHRLPAPRREGWLFWAWLHLAMPPALLALGLRHRVTHAFAFAATYGLLLQPLRLVARVPLAVFLRADAIENHRLKGRPRWLVALDTRLEGLGLAGARVLAVSRALAARVAARHPRAAARIAVLANDLPPAPAGGAPRPAPRPAPRRPLAAAAVGVLEGRKNLGLLLDALALLPAGAVHLTLFGDGPSAAALAARARERGVEAAVTFAGWTEPDLLWPRVDLLLMPSLHEGAPNAVLEALAGGVPVLASDLPEHREILPAELLLPADDAAAWAERLGRIAARPEAELAAMAAAGGAAAAPLRFDWDRAVVEAIVGAAEAGA